MVTLPASDFNDISQDSYDKLLASVCPVNLTCPCCQHAGQMTVHGYYNRRIKDPYGEKHTLHISRLMCSNCGHTHAVLPSSLVPYSQISLSDQLAVVDLHEEGEPAGEIADRVPSVDENNIKSVIRRYVLHWRQRLLSRGIVRSSADALAGDCFKAFSRQFLQIHTTPNILFLKPT